MSQYEGLHDKQYLETPFHLERTRILSFTQIGQSVNLFMV